MTDAKWSIGQGSIIGSDATWKHELKILADDGTELLAFTFADGRLDVTGDESRWTEAAARLMGELRRMFDTAPSFRVCGTCPNHCLGQWMDC